MNIFFCKAGQARRLFLSPFRELLRNAFCITSICHRSWD